MGASNLTGTPWHTTTLHRTEGDDRRHKARCYYYKNKSCKKHYRACWGSAHCNDYTEQPPIVYDQPKPVSAKLASSDTMESAVRVGVMVKHKKYGIGTITEASDGKLAVQFDDGAERVFDIGALVRLKVLEYLE